MSIKEICDIPVPSMSDVGCHLWLWTTNAFLEDGFKVLRAWGFKYLTPIHWIKPSGSGAWFINRTQTVLFGYKDKCRFLGKRYLPNIFETGNPKRHSEKPELSYEIIESISQPERLELFARRKKAGWDCWGNEIESDIQIEERVKAHLPTNGITASDVPSVAQIGEAPTS